MESGQVTIDEALEVVGSFGRGQLRQFCLVCSLAHASACAETVAGPLNASASEVTSEHDIEVCPQVSLVWIPGERQRNPDA